MQPYLQLGNIGLKETRSKTGVQTGSNTTISRSWRPPKMLGKIHDIAFVVDDAISTRSTRKA